jgi:hypothetical protein
MGTFDDDYETLYFDYNVMMLGMLNELNAHNEAMSKSGSGMTTTRQEAYALAMRARLAAEGR